MPRSSTVIRPNTDVTTSGARASRAKAWEFIFKCWQDKQKADEPAHEPADRDGTKVKEDSADAPIIRH